MNEYSTKKKNMNENIKVKRSSHKVHNKKEKNKNHYNLIIHVSCWYFWFPLKMLSRSINKQWEACNERLLTTILLWNLDLILIKTTLFNDDLIQRYVFPVTFFLPLNYFPRIFWLQKLLSLFLSSFIIKVLYLVLHECHEVSIM